MGWWFWPETPWDGFFTGGVRRRRKKLPKTYFSPKRQGRTTASGRKLRLSQNGRGKASPAAFFVDPSRRRKKDPGGRLLLAISPEQPGEGNFSRCHFALLGNRIAGKTASPIHGKDKRRAEDRGGAGRTGEPIPFYGGRRRLRPFGPCGTMVWSNRKELLP